MCRYLVSQSIKLNQGTENQTPETTLTSTQAKSAKVKALLFSSFLPLSFPATTSTIPQKQQPVLIIINFILRFFSVVVKCCTGGEKIFPLPY